MQLATIVWLRAKVAHANVVIVRSKNHPLACQRALASNNAANILRR